MTDTRVVLILTGPQRDQLVATMEAQATIQERVARDLDDDGDTHNGPAHELRLEALSVRLLARGIANAQAEKPSMAPMLPLTVK